MPLFGARSPVEDRERLWIDKMLAWCLDEYGSEALEAEVVTPTPRFFPGRYQGTQEDAAGLVDLVRAHLRIDPAEIAVGFYDGRPPPRMPGAAGSAHSSVAGHYSVRSGLGVIAVALEDAPDPRRVVAVAAHELCHHKLLYRGTVAPDEQDHEPLTDLATVFFGLGVFTANAAFTFSQSSRGWRRQQLGYINQPMFGYALARVAQMRGEDDPEWARHLETNPRGYFKQAARYLRG
ncbi:hypothetical protein GCM10009839_87220 [Catenulispora yoronensis]|uniref:DUF2268 domain-containing protein n=1 Tax=Catenulispora yoronensis TaxID=450799 RepID=A0ABN2VJW7_9ACTN